MISSVLFVVFFFFFFLCNLTEQHERCETPEDTPHFCRLRPPQPLPSTGLAFTGFPPRLCHISILSLWHGGGARSKGN